MAALAPDSPAAVAWALIDAQLVEPNGGAKTEAAVAQLRHHVEELEPFAAASYLAQIIGAMATFCAAAIRAAGTAGVVNVTGRGDLPSAFN